MPKPASRFLARSALLIVAYFASARLGLIFAFAHGNVTPFWPPAGVALAALVLGGYSFAPGVALAALVSNLSVGAPLLPACVMAVGSTLEALAGAYLLRRVGFQRTLDRLRDVLALDGLAALLPAALAATIGTAILFLAAGLTWSRFGAAWLTWWLGDVLAIVLVTPLVFAVFAKPDLDFSPRAAAEFLALVASLSFVTQIVFTMGGHYHYLVLLFLMWAAFRFGVRGTSVAALVACAIAAWNTAEGRGPFAELEVRAAVLQLDAFIGVVAFTALLFAAAVAQRRKAEDELRVLSASLQERATERTLQLEATFAALTDPVVIYDARGLPLMANPAAQSVCGSEVAGTAGAAPTETPAAALELALSHPDGRPMQGDESPSRRALAGETVVAEPALLHNQAGAERHVLVSAAPVHSDGQTTGAVVTLHDITERALTERALRESERRFRDFVEHSGDGIVLTDEQGTIIEWNRAEEQLTGIAREAALGQPVWDLHFQVRPPGLRTPDMRRRLEERVRRLLSAGSMPAQNELRELEMYAADGQKRTVEVRTFVMPTERGLRVGSTSRNTTEQRAAEEALRRSEHDLAARSQIAGIFLTAPDDLVYGEVMRAVLQLMESEDGHLSYLDRDGELVTLSMGNGDDRQRPLAEQAVRFPRTRWRHLWVRALAEKRSFFSNEPETLTRGHVPVRRALAVPILYQEEAVGLLEVINKGTEYDDSDRQLLESITAYMAPVLHARLQRDAQEKERRRAEAERDATLETLAGERNMLRALIETVPDFVYAKDTASRFVLANPAIARFMGQESPEALYGKTDFDFFPPEIAEPFFAVEQELFRTGQPSIDHEEYHGLPSGGRWFMSTKVPLRNSHGEIIGLVGIGREYTERVLFRNALQRYADRLAMLLAVDQVILATVPPVEIAGAALTHLARLVPCWLSSVVTFDGEAGEGKVLAAHGAGRRALTLGAHFVQGASSTTSLQRGETRVIDDLSALPNLPGPIQTLAAAGMRSYVNIPLLVEGQLFGMLNLGSDRQGAFSADQIAIAREVASQLAIGLQQAHLRGVVRRHTADLEARVEERTRELSETAARLQTANDALKSLDRLKSQFVSNVSHELRTPLANIKLYLSLLEAGKPEKRSQYMATLNREAELLHSLIEDLLQLSRLDLGKVEPLLLPVDLNELLTTLANDRSAMLVARGLSLQTRIAPDLPRVAADSKMLNQVLTNLMTNAMNYTPPGGMITVLTEQRTGNGEPSVTLSVADNGRGMNEDDLAHVFERFYRGTAAQQSRVPGTGLGLAICQEIMQRHHGKITVESQHGVGSTFTIWLPVCGEIETE